MINMMFSFDSTYERCITIVHNSLEHRSKNLKEVTSSALVGLNVFLSSLEMVKVGCF